MNVNATTQSQDDRLEFSLRPVPSELPITGGRNIPFKRAILSIRNAGNAEIVRFVPHATAAQEGGSVQDITDALRRDAMTELLPPGKAVEWDIYDLLLNAHPGIASKVHLWGYKAILNWWIDLSVWAEHSSSSDMVPLHTPISKWKLRWTPAQSPTEEVDVTIEMVER